MNLNKIFCIVLIALIVSVSFSFIIFKKFIDYKETNPPVTSPGKEDCNIQGLVFHWQFDEIQEGVTPDSSVNGFDGKIMYFFNNKYLSKIVYGKPIITEEKKGNALQFNGKQWVSAGNRSCYNVDQFTISLWIFQENDNIYMPTIMAKSSWSGGNNGWWLCTTPKTRLLEMGIAWENGLIHAKSGYHLPLNEWHHVAVSVDNINHEIQFYVDGTPFGAKQTNVHEWSINWNHDLFIAGYDGSGRWSWPGKLDDVRFYTGLLLADEIYSIYAEH